MGRNGIVDELGHTPLTSQEVLDLDHVLSTEAGRRVYRRLLFDVSRMRDHLFAGAVKDGMAIALHDAFARGFQAIATTMDDEVRAYLPGRYEQLFTEQFRAEAQRREAQRKEQQQRQQEEPDDGE